MKTVLFESKTFLGKAVTVLATSEAPLKGFIFPVEFEGSGGIRNKVTRI